MRDLNKRSSFINAVIYIYDQCAFVVRECCRGAQGERWHLDEFYRHERGRAELDGNETTMQSQLESV